MARKLRETLGDDILLFHDAVESYTVEEAVKSAAYWRSTITGGSKSRCRTTISWG